MFFGAVLESGKKYEQEPDLALHLSMATVQPSKDGKAEIVSVYCHTEDGKFLICSLDPSKNYQVPLDLTFIEGQQVTLSTEGPASVHITGYYMPEPDLEFDDESVSDLDEEGESEDLDGEDEAVEATKRPAPVAAGPATKKAKPAAGQAPAKTNGQAGKQVVPSAAGDDSDDDQEDDDDESDEEDLNALLANIKKNAGKGEAGSKKAAAVKKETGSGEKMQVSGEDDDDDDGEEADDDVDDEEESDDEEQLVNQQKQLKQSLQAKGQQDSAKKPNGQQAGGKGQQPNKPQFGRSPQNVGQNRPNFHKGGNQSGGKFQHSPGFRGGRGGGGRGGGGRGGGGRGGGRGGGAGGTPYNKNKGNFSPHGQKTHKQF